MSSLYSRLKAAPLPPAPQQPFSAAVALALAGEETALEVCMIQRAIHPGDRWSGQMAFPGGKIDPEDQSPLHAARRETLEEVGIELPLHPLATLPPTPFNHQKKSLAAFVFALGPEKPPFFPNAEVQAAFWIPLAQLFDPTYRMHFERTEGGQPRRFPAIYCKAEPIWGLSYRIVENFARLL